MKYVKFYFVGILFGFVLAKAEIVSWYRIQEMFFFHSFHMYGVIGSAVILGIICVLLIKKMKWKNAYGQLYRFKEKKKTLYRYILGGSIFGLGWSLTGACPGPMYILLGYGYSIYAVIIASAILGTFTYGLVKKYLPH